MHPKDPVFLEWEERSCYDGIYEPTTFLLLLWNCGQYLKYWIRYLCFSQQALDWLLHRYMLRLQTSQVSFHLPYKMLLPIGVMQVKHHQQLYSNSWEICCVSIKTKPIKAGNTRQGHSIIFCLGGNIVRPDAKKYSCCSLIYWCCCTNSFCFPY